MHHCAPLTLELELTDEWLFPSCFYKLTQSGWNCECCFLNSRLLISHYKPNLSSGCNAFCLFHTNRDLPHGWRLKSTASHSTGPHMEHTFGSIINILRGMLNNWSELGCLSAQQSFACSWWICGIQFTLQGERGNIVLSCVSVFTAHSLINYSAGPSDCDLQFWEKGPSLHKLRWICDRTSLIVLHCGIHKVLREKKNLKLPPEMLLCCFKWSLSFIHLRVKLATQGHFILFSLLCLCGEWQGSVCVCAWAHTRVSGVWCVGVLESWGDSLIERSFITETFS